MPRKLTSSGGSNSPRPLFCVHALDQRTQFRVLLVRDAPHGEKHVALLLRLLTGLVEPLVDELRHDVVHSRSPFSLLLRFLVQPDAHDAGAASSAYTTF